MIADDYGTTRNIHFQQVPITQGTETQWRSIYHLALHDIKKGERIVIYCEGQIANNLDINIELAQILEIRTSVSGGMEPIEGPYVGQINGWNVSREMHYGRFSKGDLYVAPEDYEVLHIVCRLRCRSTGAQDGDYVTVKPKQGLMYYYKI